MMGLLSIVWNIAPAHGQGASLSDFKRAAIEHSRFQACFKAKLQSGYCRFGDGDTNLVRSFSGEQLEERISLRLSLLSDTGYKTAALVYFEAPDDSLGIFLFDDSGFRASSIRSFADIGGTVSGMRHTLGINTRAAPQRAGGPVASGEPLSEAQYRIPLEDSNLLLPAAIGEQINTQGYNRILILPSTWTSAVPFPALKLPDGRHLVDAVSTVVLPDLDALILPLGIEEGLLNAASEGLTFNGSEAVQGTSLVVGDPHYASYRGDQLAKLPGAHLEANTVAEMLGAENLLMGKAATHGAVSDALAGFEYQGGIIYIASHGISSDENPMDESLIALSQRHFPASEIRDLEFRLNHPLVVLSACQTGLGKQFGGGSFGLLRAWYHAGAGQVIGSLWNVSDTGTLGLMVEFSRTLTNGEDRPEEALRQAMLIVRKKHTEDPAIWASFYVFGNPAR